MLLLNVLGFYISAFVKTLTIIAVGVLFKYLVSKCHFITHNYPRSIIAEVCNIQQPDITSFSVNIFPISLKLFISINQRIQFSSVLIKKIRHVKKFISFIAFIACLSRGKVRNLRNP